MSYPKRASKEELDKLYEAWAGQAAMQADAQSATYDPAYMVLVHRWTNRAGKRLIQRSEFLFATEEYARKCMDFWRARGGLMQLALLKFEYAYGYNEEPEMVF